MPRDDVTAILRELGPDNPDAAEQLVPILYDELRAIAGKFMRAEREGHTLQPTALVHEAFIRLVDQRSVHWENRAHFLAVASRVMRRILVDHARRQRAEKRGGGRRVTLSGDIVVTRAGADIDVIALDHALERLHRIDGRAHRAIELRFFAGLALEEIAAVLGVAVPTVKRDLRFARACLARDLANSPTDERDLSPPG